MGRLLSSSRTLVVGAVAAVVALVAPVAGGCIEDVYVPGAVCATSAGCPPPPESPDDPVSTIPEQCVQTGVVGEAVCVFMPLARPATACPDGAPTICLNSGFPVEVQCFEGQCQCPNPTTTACAPWNPLTCACGGVTP